MDAVSLVVNALTSGATQGIADTVSDAVTSAYAKLKRLVSAKFAGNSSAEVALVEHASDPETWQAPLTKYLAGSGADSDEAIVQAAQQLLALLDPAGTAQGKYRVDLRGAQGVQVGDGNQNTTPSTSRLMWWHPRRSRSGPVSRGTNWPSAPPTRRRAGEHA